MKNGQGQELRWARSSIVQCPECSSYNAEALDIRLSKVRCRCTDCGTVYWARARKVSNADDKGSAGEDGEEQDFTPRRRKTKADYRAEIAPAPPPPTPFIQREVDAAVAGGAAGLRASQRVALKAAKRYMADLEDFWRRDTAYLTRKATESSECSRACARYARRWRPRFLAVLSITNSPTLAARVARINPDTAFEHRKHDPEFAQFWVDACERAVDLLEARAFQRALEGDLEPVYYMGVVVDYVRKFDSRLQVELLRAKRPATFKTPGVNVNVGVKSDVFVLTEEQRHILMEANRKWLLAQPSDETEQSAPPAAESSDDNNS